MTRLALLALLAGCVRPVGGQVVSAQVPGASVRVYPGVAWITDAPARPLAQGRR